MPELVVTLITGRSTRQGVGVSTGKHSSEYQEAIQTVQLNPQDMAQAGLKNGSRITVKNSYGSIEATCVAGGLARGLAFMAFGTACNRLIGSETYASGMPDSKHVQVEISPAPGEPESRDRGK